MVQLELLPASMRSRHRHRFASQQPVLQEAMPAYQAYHKRYLQQIVTPHTFLVAQDANKGGKELGQQEPSRPHHPGVQA